MERSNLSVDKYDHEIDLKELFQVLWVGKVRIIFITTAFAIGSVFYALSLPNQYKATAILAPAQTEEGGLSSALDQLGGLASLAGVRVSSGQIREAQVAIEVMQSWSFVDKFIADNDLSVEVYAAKGWNKLSDELQINDTVYESENRVWLLKTNKTNELRPPTSWELFKRFQNILSVSLNAKTGLVEVSIEYYSPKLAKQWLDMYIAKINEHMQARQVEKVSNNISYLEAQIDKTSIAEMREVFYTIIEEQTKNKMVAEASPEYAFVTVSPSMTPEEKSQPKRALICVLGTFLGGMISVLSLVFGLYIKGTDRNEQDSV